MVYPLYDELPNLLSRKISPLVLTPRSINVSPLFKEVLKLPEILDWWKISGDFEARSMYGGSEFIIMLYGPRDPSLHIVRCQSREEPSIYHGPHINELYQKVRSIFPRPKL
ncbi:MAG: hypothetical protein ACP5NS_01670 [Candidatus Pacearchaeota archaeon]